MRWIIPGLLALAIGLTGLPIPAETGRKEAGQAAERFARALSTGESEALQALLPQSGKILVSISDIGQGAGYFGRSQVEALFSGYLAEFDFSDCRIDHIEVQESSYSRIDLTANRTGPGDAVSAVVFRLAFQPEQDRWVLREIRESGR
ncbi:MAG: hypothetical protein IFK94_12965 [Acidobacteria bacterium]|uniref:Uncharacterized protein n=1 Tax=Candidatus Polarisedimenticola svalbardensis TaxID=2886004 RepID=A0A8J7CDQ1_9BACT|nr:hypothetical protein [Candidatus Polarisedimenticola svalbardensis]